MSQEQAGESFGSTLRAARERRGVSLRQIANATKISLGVLEALERNDFSRLPGGIFSRAFIRSYAAEVGLDPDATIQDFLAQLPTELPSSAVHHAAEPIEDYAAVESDRQAASTLLRLVLISVPIAATVAYLSVRGARPEPTPAAAAPVESVSRTPVAPPPPFGSASQADAPPSALPATAPSDSEVPRAAGPAVTDDEPVERLLLSVSASRICWLSLTVDGQRTMRRLLQPGEERTIEARREIVLTVGDAGAIRMVVNGAEARPLGRPGEVVTARLTPTNFRQYLSVR